MAQRQRDLTRTREKIMQAALAEFSAKGLAGARTDAIVRRAGVNKRMLFYCFGSKEALYDEVLRDKLAQRLGAIASCPEQFTDALVHWYQACSNDLDWIRLLEWEALGVSKDSPLVAEAERDEVLKQAVAKFEHAFGAVTPDVDLAQLFLSVVALTAFPLAFPQITRQVTGMDPTDPRFRRRRLEFLRWLGAKLATDQVRHRRQEDTAETFSEPDGAVRDG